MIIKFNKKIYKLNAIKSAEKQYKELADFSLEKKGDYFFVKLKNIDKNVEGVIRDEFCNYVLGLIKT